MGSAQEGNQVAKPEIWDEKRRRYEELKAQDEELYRLLDESSLLPISSSRDDGPFIRALFYVGCALFSMSCVAMVFILWSIVSPDLWEANETTELCPQVAALYPTKHQAIYQDLVDTYFDTDSFKDYIIDTVSIWNIHMITRTERYIRR